MRLFTLSILLLLTAALFAQGESDLLSLVDADEQTEYATASFKSTKVINGQSIEHLAAGVLDFRIAHRFGSFQQGAYDLFGLDAATIRLSLDYGLTDRLMVGIGRSSYQKTVDASVKYRLLRQRKGAENMPFSLSYYADVQVNGLRFSDPSRENLFRSRLAFTHQLLLARKFSERLTLQLMPTLTHRNLVQSAQDRNDIFSMGFAGRFKITKRLALTAEYYYTFPDQIISTPYRQPLAVGLDIETGGHVFQLHITNAQAMTYNGLITDTTQGWFYDDGNGKTITGIRFGFNLSRVFTVVKPKGYTPYGL
jgi:hypothetical protein